MRIIVNESQLRLLREACPESWQNTKQDRMQNIEAEKVALEDYIEEKGEYMTDITNGKTYMVQYLKALSVLVGKKYAMCAPVKSDGTYGAFYVKPYDTFRKDQKAMIQSGMNNTQADIKPNLYQRMGLNK